jgi:hypothetical protein
MPRGVVAAVTGLLLCLSPAGALGRAGGEGHTLDLGGSIRTFVFALDTSGHPLLYGEESDVEGLSDTILRLTADGRTGSKGFYEVHVVQDLLLTTAPAAAGGGAIGIADTTARYRALDLSWIWLEEEDVEARLSLDRLNGGGSRGRTDLRFGRQAINFSQAWFWNPLDVFLSFDPEAFDRSYKAGVDALRADVALGPFSSLTFVAAAGNELILRPTGEGLRVAAVNFSEEPWYGSAGLVRVITNRSHWDLTLQGGKVYGGWQVGAGFSGEVGPLGLRGEGTYLYADDGGEAILPDPGSASGLREVPLIEDHGMIVIGADHRFDSSLYLNAEYFYNGAGEDSDYELSIARVAVGETTNLGVHYVGLLASYEIFPILTGQISWIHSFTDGSDLLSPVFSWSVADEAECLFGAILGFGDAPGLRTAADGTEYPALESEYGSYPNTYFLELIFYF